MNAAGPARLRRNPARRGRSGYDALRHRRPQMHRPRANGCPPAPADIPSFPGQAGAPPLARMATHPRRVEEEA